MDSHWKRLADAGREFSGPFGLDGDRVAAKLGPKRVGAIEGDELSLVHDRNAVSPIGFVEQVGRQDDGRSLAATGVPGGDTSRGRCEHRGRCSVRAAATLRAMEHALGEFDATPHPAGEGFHQIVRASVRPTAPSNSSRRLQFARREAVEATLVAEIFSDGELLVEAGGLEDDAELAADGGRLAAQVVTEDRDLALLERNERR